MRLPPMTKTYSGRTVLDVPEIELADGAVHAVIGANGSGKSTLARLAAGAIRPDDGRDARPARAGYMPQRSYAFHMSALSNLRLTGADRARAQAQLEAFGLGALARQKAPSLSGGETARLALARLLQECTLPQCENVFAQLARLLSALRHADAGAAAKAVEGYASILLALQEAR